MHIEIIDNSIMLIAAISGLLYSLFRYIEKPRRGWLYMIGFFMMHLLSDYYWTIYVLVIHSDPDVAGLSTYFGWNMGYIFLLLTILCMRVPVSKKYFHPLMLLPIPLNIWQFILYLPYGGIVNNIFQGTVLTVLSCLCLQSLLFYLKNRKTGAYFPYTQFAVLLFVVTEYGMWTISCFDWSKSPLDPYYIASFLNYLIMILMARAVEKDHRIEGFTYQEKSASDLKFQMMMQTIALFAIFGGCIGGYYLAVRMKGSIPSTGGTNNVYDLIAIALFFISVLLVIIIMALVFAINLRIRRGDHGKEENIEKRQNRYSFIIIIVVTAGLMVFSVFYTSRMFYEVSVESIYSQGEDTAALYATEINDYLSSVRVTLEITADTIDLMLTEGETKDRIANFLKYQTDNQSDQLDENFTGLYGYICGEFMIGSDWVPPEGFDATERVWYEAAVDADGRIILVSPYVDAQTGEVVVTLAKMIGDTKGRTDHNVVAIDIIVDRIQDITEGMDVGGKGYGMVINRNGMIVAHREPQRVGRNLMDYYGKVFLDQLKAKQSGTLNAMVDGEECTFFISQVMDQWYVVIAENDAELLEETYSQLTVNVIVSLIIFALISIFYFFGYKSEQVYGRNMEEMRAGRQKQEYEAKVLKLEKKASDEANKAKSSFLADMSHEIRTPINAILGMNEMILREADSDNILEYSRNISASGKNLLQLVNSILDFSKIEDGKMEIVPVTYSVSDMITYLLNSVSERARGKGLQLNAEISPTIPSSLYGDDARISQVIINLLTNAVKYTHEGEVTLKIKENDRKDDKVLLYVEVTDTGIGIRKSDLQKLFESFERLDLKRNRNIEGTGLGMSIATSLLELMGSELMVKSIYGEGSTFWFELWQKIESDVPLGDYNMDSTGSPNAASQKATFHAPDACILIVDDTKMNITVAVNLLKRTGIRIDTALSGEAAVELAGRNKYDVILLDQRMPGMDGTQALKMIRDHRSRLNADTPVICLTADAIRGARERYLAQGFDDYLTKPVDGRLLEIMLMTYLPKDKLQEDPAGESQNESGPVDQGTIDNGAVDRGTEDSGPVEKETEDSGPEDKGDEKDGDLLIDELEKIGVDTKEGMEICADDMDIYKEILSEYASDSKDRRECLVRYHEEKDWDNYRIHAHSLKSSSKTIGAMDLSEIAKGLEEASANKDEEAIERDHDKALGLYDEIVSVIKANS